MRWLGLSDKERQLEELCDKERYYSLEMNEEEEEMYKGALLLPISSNFCLEYLMCKNFRGGRKEKENECYSLLL